MLTTKHTNYTKRIKHLPNPISQETYDKVLTKFDEWPSYVDPRERFILLSSTRPGGFGGDDLYVAVRENGHWSAAQNLGPLVNSFGFEDSAVISPDRMTLFYSSRSYHTLSQMYQIRIAVLPPQISSLLAG
ncbi:MAG: PD40 domain-containing protein [Acidobacteria bacterium]|nr:PD40 domain-containing protein [Acidobacteriota bacterium]